MRIYKYPLLIIDRQKVEISATSEILCVQLQYGAPVLYVLTDMALKVLRVISTYGTGDLIPDQGRRRYIGTYQMGEGAMVKHVFEEFDDIQSQLCNTRSQKVVETKPAKAVSSVIREHALCAD